MTLTALVVDDESPARDRLTSLLREINQVQVVGEAADARQALALVHELKPDIVYLDVRMPEMNGLELARHLSLLDSPPAVIFTTAHNEHAMAAFEADAVGYLLKPIRKEKLAAATERAAALTRMQLDTLSRRTPRSHLAVRLRDGLKLLRVEDVVCLVAEQKYTTVRHAAGIDLIDDSLRTLETEFADLFLRIHRNTLVSRKWIEGIERDADGQYQVRLRGIAEALPVSRRLAPELKQRFEANHPS
jgi:two-component system, LytTR family, response regulator AlgR